MADTESEGKRAIVAVMGATGTGKSTFIKHLTGDENIVIGHNPESETFDVETYFYTYAETDIMLIDTPGFDDSRDGVTDTDILEKIVAFLQQDELKLNGIIYMHRISDPRMGGMSRKNLRMFRELCGSSTISNVRIVTTNWDRVGKQEGADREAALAKGAFKSLIDAGARMARQDNERESALLIMSELIHKPSVEVKVVEEVKAGKTLAQTGAGVVLNEEMQDLQKKHEKELQDLRKEIEEAAAAKDEKLKAELAEERQLLEEKMTRLEKDQTRLEQTTIEELRRKLEESEFVNRKLKTYAESGAAVRFFKDMRSVVHKGQKMGGVPGALAGLAIAPAVATKRFWAGR